MRRKTIDTRQHERHLSLEICNVCTHGVLCLKDQTIKLQLNNVADPIKVQVDPIKYKFKKYNQSWSGSTFCFEPTIFFKSFFFF